MLILFCEFGFLFSGTSAWKQSPAQKASLGAFSVLLVCFVKCNFVYCASTLVWVSCFSSQTKELNLCPAQRLSTEWRSRREMKGKIKEWEKILLLEKRFLWRVSWCVSILMGTDRLKLPFTSSPRLQICFNLEKYRILFGSEWSLGYTRPQLTLSHQTWCKCIWNSNQMRSLN